MKKEYNKPEAIIVEIRSTQMMASSPLQYDGYNGHNLKFIEIDVDADDCPVW